MEALGSVSIDLDPLGCYAAIHGLPPPPDELRHVVLRRGLPRLGELLERLGLRATFFVVGSDLEEDAEGRALLGEMARAGHELANHSYWHSYRFARQGLAAVSAELMRAHAAIAEVAGRPPVGFRAPGYDLTHDVVQVLVERGYRYDSSLLPAPLYWLAKLGVMGGMALLGRRSRAVVTPPRALWAPLDPYRLDEAAFWRPGSSPLWELPIAVTARARLWVIGTSIMLAPPWLRRRLLAGLAGRRHLNFELHGIDLVDAQDGIPGAIVDRQPDLRLPLAEKQRILEETLRELSRRARFLPLVEVGEELARGERVATAS